MENNRILSEIIVQILGFGVVFLVLKQVAWSKLLGSIDARRKAIENAFAEVERKQGDMENLERQYKQKLENIEQEARQKIQEAAQAGMALAKDIQDKARIDAQKLIDRARAEIDQDLAKARVKMRDDLVELSGLLTEKILREKLDAQGHRKLVDQFVTNMEKV
jgi:F-type H+-transporting ATPase subunit b